MSSPNRRDFLQTATLASLAAPTSRILGANDRINLAIIGLGGRGTAHMNGYVKQDCHIAGLCDVNQAAQERGVALVEKAKGHKPKVFADMREVFADKSIDAVSIATPNHWHSLATIWACQAGKDVYVEKPASHNVWEGRKMVEAARKYKRMVQIGSQSRSIPHKMKAIKLLHEGVIGDVYMAKALCFKRRKSIGHAENTPVPPGVNWEMFLGPAPMRPFNELRFKYNWHWFWDTGNGDIGNQGVHEMDIARWGLGKAMPKSVVSTGGKFAYNDDQETPNTQLATLDYGGSEIVFEVRGLLTGGEGGMVSRGGNYVGNLFYGTEGHMTLDGSSFQVYKGEDSRKIMDEKVDKEVNDTGAHMENFLKAVKSRKHEDLHAEVEIGAISAALCHLANISYRVGRKLSWDANKWQFTGDAEANRMLTRDYRKPYVVPEKV